MKAENAQTLNDETIVKLQENQQEGTIVKMEKINQLKEEIIDTFLESIDNPKFIDLLTKKGLEEALVLDVSIDLTKLREQVEEEVKEGVIQKQELQEVRESLLSIPVNSFALFSSCWCTTLNKPVRCNPFICPPSN
ncbi:hypothetical protein NIES267_54470 [Calothrix parasitica NIES-267]|uniref:Uncharacterized protein n=1 Tax=Calothrix parasitica NIES-267 TaxID=1973488 RepID=A0A1Z4LXR5_9CYAN|nr:hypothetical protein NIES267_54470 [Calothrix parasitica NIES-267]